MKVILARLVSGVVGLLLFTLAMPAASRADVRWLCHPSAGAREDACEQALDTTAIAADGTRSVARPSRVAQRRRPVDCFYVYPTVSNQTTLNATKAADPEIVAVTQYQASRFSRVCRMFVPLYRQVTLADIAGNTVPNGPITIAYADVLEAWRSYLAHDNHGRGVILLGHSQGSILLRQLVRTQIDPNPALRARLVGATLLGGNVTVRDGRTMGGDFQHISLCKRRGEEGCVVAYSTFSTDPGPTTGFGNTNTDMLSNAFGEPHGAGYQVACTDPARLSGATGPFSVEVPTKPFPPGGIKSGIDQVAGDNIPAASTTWVKASRYAGGCRTVNDAHVLRYDPVDGSPMLKEFPPGFGTHLVDFNLGLDRLVAIARRERRTYLRRAFAAGRLRARRTRITVPVPGAGTVTVRGPRIRTQRRRVRAPGRVALAIRPRRGARARRTAIRLIYRPGGGRRIVRRTRIAVGKR